MVVFEIPVEVSIKDNVIYVSVDGESVTLGTVGNLKFDFKNDQDALEYVVSQLKYAFKCCGVY